MSGIDYQKQEQDYCCNATIIILGSGASATHGRSGVCVLAKHLIANPDTLALPAAEVEAGGGFCQFLLDGVDLESALHPVAVTEELTSGTITATGPLISSEDVQILRDRLHNQAMCSLSKLWFLKQCEQPENNSTDNRLRAMHS